MKYMLDTNICIYLIKQQPREVIDKFQGIALGEIAVSTVTVAEMMYGGLDSVKRIPLIFRLGSVKAEYVFRFGPENG
jgi:predicted nucleic acid-binding protein